jgi:ceramide glucosyltransferase
VRTADEPFPQPLGRRNIAGIWQRQLRWARLRRLSFPGFFCVELPAGGAFPLLLACWLATAGVLPWPGVAGMMLAWYGAEALLARAFGWPLRARSPLFWIARDLLLPVLWARAWAAKGYEWRGNPVDLRPTTRAPCAPSGSAPPPVAARLRVGGADTERAHVE